MGLLLDSDSEMDKACCFLQFSDDFVIQRSVSIRLQSNNSIPAVHLDILSLKSIIYSFHSPFCYIQCTELTKIYFWNSRLSVSSSCDHCQEMVAPPPPLKHNKSTNGPMDNRGSYFTSRCVFGHKKTICSLRMKYPPEGWTLLRGAEACMALHDQ